MYTVYVIQSLIDSSLYTGYSKNFNKRLRAHNVGKVRSTKAYKPYKLIYKEEYSDKSEARRREVFLKTGRGRDFIKSILSCELEKRTGVRVV